MSGYNKRIVVVLGIFFLTSQECLIQRVLLKHAATARVDDPNAPPTLLSASPRSRDHERASVHAAPTAPDQGTQVGSDATEAGPNHHHHHFRSPPHYAHLPLHLHLHHQ